MSLLIGTTSGAFSIDDPANPVIAGTRINHLARSGEDWWALDGKSRVHRNGEIVATAPGSPLNCIVIGADVVWVGASEARLFRLDGPDLVEDRAFADAPGRDEWYTPWGGPPDVRSLALDASGTLYVNVHVGGIVRYGDRGPTATIDKDADVHHVITHPTRPALILAACAMGLARSDDGGRTYDIRDDGLHATYCRAVASSGDTVLVSASTGPRTTQARLYRAGVEDGSFQPCTEGLPEWFGENLDTHCLAVLERTVFAGLGDKVWRSDDEGGTWELAVDGLPKVTCLA